VYIEGGDHLHKFLGRSAMNFSSICIPKKN
jgi:hypothetical protein